MKVFCIVLTLFISLSVSAQEIKVKSMELLPSDLTARTNLRLDGNDEPCALIKVIVPTVEGMQFGGWVIGNIGYLPGEYQVYVPAGTKKITFRHPNYAPGEIRFTIPIEGKCTYRVTLDVPQKEKGLESVEQGDAASMLKMAQNYENGSGAYNINIQQALEWYEKAAEAGNVEAQEYIAEVSYAGKNGFRKDVNKALKWNDVCAKRGNETAIYRLAELHKGLGLNEQAIVWYKKYNELHPSQNIQYQLAQLYDNNHPDRNKWLKIAADNGHVEAAYELATRLAPIDHQTAAIYYQKAVDANHAMAKNDYGTYLITGKYGFIKDEAKGKALIGSLGAQSAELKTEDTEMAPYIAQIPDLLQAVKHGDADAILKLMLIYIALGDELMTEKMRVVALYNFSYGYDYVPIPQSYDDYLIKKIKNLTPIDRSMYDGKKVYAKFSSFRKTNFNYLLDRLIYPIQIDYNYAYKEISYTDFLKMFSGCCVRTKELIDNNILESNNEISVKSDINVYISNDYLKHDYQLRNFYDVNEQYYMPILRCWGSDCHEEDVMKRMKDINLFRLHTIIPKNRQGVRQEEISTLFEYSFVKSIHADYTKELQEKKLSGFSKKFAKEQVARAEYLLNNANIMDKDAKFIPWLRQLKMEGYFWTPSVAAQAKAIHAQNVQEKKEEVKNKELATIAKQHEIIRVRGKKKGAKTFEVKGVPFNMVLIKPNPKAKYSDWNSGVTDYAPKASYYIAETEVTQELWDAVMGTSSKSDVLQQPKYTKDTNEWPEFETFINKLNKLTGKRFRVPSHAEWEYAAHGGALTGSPYCIDRHTADEYRFKDYQVAQGTPNELGLYDILTGVMEFNKKPSYGWPSPDKGCSGHFGLRLALSAQ